MGATVSTDVVARVRAAMPERQELVGRFMDALDGGLQWPAGNTVPAPETGGVPTCPSMADCARRIVLGGQSRCGERGLACVVAAKAKEPCLERQEKRWGEEVEAPNVYRLRLGHKAWSLVIQGKRDVVGDERAVHLVDYLLKNPPDEAIHGSVLENCVDGSPVIDGFDGIECDAGGVVFDGAVGGVIQEGAGKKLMGKGGALLKKKLAELHADIGNVTLLASEREKAQDELDELLSSAGRGGKMIGAAGQSVDRVRKVIKRFIGDLRTAELSNGEPNAVLQAFGEHLHQHLWLPSMGAKRRGGASGRPGCFIYEPPVGVVWRD